MTAWRFLLEVMGEERCFASRDKRRRSLLPGVMSGRLWCGATASSLFDAQKRDDGYRADMLLGKRYVARPTRARVILNFCADSQRIYR